jgi:hypothetical protein
LLKTFCGQNAVFHVRAGVINRGVEAPIVAAQLSLDDMEITTASVSFEVNFEAGPYKLHGWFTDDAGEPVCGAFFGYIRQFKTLPAPGVAS